jgi:hypothetical protein
MINLLDEMDKPSWVIYHLEYLAMVKNGKDEFLPWYLMDKEQLLIRFKGIQKRYPTRSLFPFARDDQSDDVACWEKDKPGRVVLIHDFASPGYENKKEFESFEEWYIFVTTNY